MTANGCLPQNYNRGWRFLTRICFVLSYRNDHRQLYEVCCKYGLYDHLLNYLKLNHTVNKHIHQAQRVQRVPSGSSWPASLKRLWRNFRTRLKSFSEIDPAMFAQQLSFTLKISELKIKHLFCLFLGWGLPLSIHLNHCFKLAIYTSLARVYKYNWQITR